MDELEWIETTIKFANNYLNKLVCIKWSTPVGTSERKQIGILVDAEVYVGVVMLTLDCANGSENVVLGNSQNLISIQEYSDIDRMLFKLEHDIS